MPTRKWWRAPTSIGSPTGRRAWPRSGRYPTVDMLDVVDIMLATGARIGEALAIRWKDIDLKSEKPTVTVKRNIVYMPRQGLTIQDHPKPPIPPKILLPAFAVEMLLRRQMAAGSQSLGRGLPLCRWNAPRPEQLPQTVVHGA